MLKKMEGRKKVALGAAVLAACLVGSAYVVNSAASAKAMTSTVSHHAYRWSNAYDCQYVSGLEYKCTVTKVGKPTVADNRCDLREEIETSTFTSGWQVETLDNCRNACHSQAYWDAKYRKDDYAYGFYAYGSSFAYYHSCVCKGYYCHNPWAWEPTPQPTPRPTTPPPTPEPTPRPTTQPPTPRPTYSWDVDIAGPVSPQQNNVLQTVTFGTRTSYELQMDLTLNSANTVNAWPNILHVGNEWWIRQPLISLNPNSNKLHFTIRQNNNAGRIWNPKCDDGAPLTVGQEYNIRVTFESGTLTVYFDGVQVCQEPGLVPYIWSDAQNVWFGDDSPRADVTVRNLRFRVY